MKRRVVIKKLQYVLESTIKKRRKNMKLKKNFSTVISCGYGIVKCSSC